MIYKNYKLVNLKCNIMNIPKISKKFKHIVDNIEFSIKNKQDDTLSIWNYIQYEINDKNLSFEVQKII